MNRALSQQRADAERGVLIGKVLLKSASRPLVMVRIGDSGQHLGGGKGKKSPG